MEIRLSPNHKQAKFFHSLILRHTNHTSQIFPKTFYLKEFFFSTLTEVLNFGVDPTIENKGFAEDVSGNINNPQHYQLHLQQWEFSMFCPLQMLSQTTA